MNQQEYKINHTLDGSERYNYTVKGINPSTIITKLIKLAGRLCDAYASDIVYIANNFRKATETEQFYSKYLFFREQGIEEIAYDELDFMRGTTYLQSWHLTYEPGINEQTLRRVYISELQ